MLNYSFRNLVPAGGLALLALTVGLLIGPARSPLTAHAQADAADRGQFTLANLTGDYHAVALTNGAVYIGQLSKSDTGMPVLRNVYYVHCETDKDTKQVTNVLVKRGKEWHGPDRMYLNPAHILLIEPVSSNSRVADLVRAGKN